jgi:RNA polymerase subunit RPABC4/transcription elongation factor Spt4
MNTCGNCNEQVMNNAEVCPYCGGNPYKGAPTIWGWIVLAVILFWIFG